MLLELKLHETRKIQDNSYIELRFSDLQSRGVLQAGGGVRAAGGRGVRQIRLLLVASKERFMGGGGDLLRGHLCRSWQLVLRR